MNPATCGTNLGTRKRGFDPSLRAGGWAGTALAKSSRVKYSHTCRNVAHIRQSRLDSGLGVQLQGLEWLQVVPSSPKQQPEHIFARQILAHLINAPFSVPLICTVARMNPVTCG